jgi:hypothetical protein
VYAIRIAFEIILMLGLSHPVGAEVYEIAKHS